MSARPTPVAAVQTRAHDRTAFTERWPAHLARIAAAAESGARLIVVPEGTAPAYVIGEEAVDRRELESAAEDVIRIAARTGATVVYGSARPHDGGVANSAYIVTRDGIAGFADKCFLWHFDRRWFSAGTALEPVDTPVGRLGVFICADGRIPTIPDALVARGAEVLVVPTAWVTSGRDPRALENIQADLMIPRAGARERRADRRGQQMRRRAAQRPVLREEPDRRRRRLDRRPRLAGCRDDTPRHDRDRRSDRRSAVAAAAGDPARRRPAAALRPDRDRDASWIPPFAPPRAPPMRS